MSTEPQVPVTPDLGEAVIPEPQLTEEQKLARTLAGHTCRGQWWWCGGQMTTWLRCTTCGHEWEPTTPKQSRDQ